MVDGWHCVLAWVAGAKYGTRSWSKLVPWFHWGSVVRSHVRRALVGARREFRPVCLAGSGADAPPLLSTDRCVRQSLPCGGGVVELSFRRGPPFSGATGPICSPVRPNMFIFFGGVPPPPRSAPPIYSRATAGQAPRFRPLQRASAPLCSVSAGFPRRASARATGAQVRPVAGRARSASDCCCSLCVAASELLCRALSGQQGAACSLSVAPVVAQALGWQRLAVLIVVGRRKSPVVWRWAFSAGVARLRLVLRSGCGR